jgi:hypothetical protein
LPRFFVFADSAPKAIKKNALKQKNSYLCSPKDKTMTTAQEVLQMIKGGETSHLQLKEDVKNATSIAQEIVAFANSEGNDFGMQNCRLRVVFTPKRQKFLCLCD